MTYLSDNVGLSNIVFLRTVRLFDDTQTFYYYAIYVTETYITPVSVQNTGNKKIQAI